MYHAHWSVQVPGGWFHPVRRSPLFSCFDVSLPPCRRVIVIVIVIVPVTVIVPVPVGIDIQFPRARV